MNYVDIFFDGESSNFILVDGINLVINSRNPWPLGKFGALVNPFSNTYKDMITLEKNSFRDFRCRLAITTCVREQDLSKILVTTNRRLNEKFVSGELGIIFARLAKLLFHDLDKTGFDHNDLACADYIKSQHGYDHSEAEDWFGFFNSDEPGLQSDGQFFVRPKMLVVQFLEIGFDASIGAQGVLDRYDFMETQNSWERTNFDRVDFFQYSHRLRDQSELALEPINELDFLTYIKSGTWGAYQKYRQSDWQ